MTGRRRAEILLASTLLALSCAPLRYLIGLPPRIAECPGVLVPSSSIEGDFLRRFRVQVSSDAVRVGYDLAVQKREGRLVVVGFSRFGARVFSIVQDGVGIQVDSVLGSAAAVPPENILRDLHLALWLHPGAVEAVEVREELMVDGRMRRWIDMPKGTVVVDGDRARHDVRVESVACGYRTRFVELL